jgi:GTP:adenosylcobinamide-phosphate guanylyltransferase
MTKLPDINPADRTTPFTAVVLAGQRSRNDPVARASGVPCKAFAPVGGKPMVLRVLETLAATAGIGKRILCGPDKSLLEQLPPLREAIDRGEVHWIPSEGTPSRSAAAALAETPANAPVVLTTADHALLEPSVVRYFCNQAREGNHDVLFGLADAEEVMLAFPQTRRTRHRFRDGGYCGCNLFAFMNEPGRSAVSFWQRVERHRKNPLRLVSELGAISVLRYVLGHLTLDQALRGLSHRAGANTGAVLLPFPRAAIDVDTARDLALVEKLLAMGSVGGP